MPCRILRFEYASVGLPGLDAEPYVSGEYLLGMALSTLMRVPPVRRAVRAGRLSLDESRQLLRFYESGLEGYTDLDEP